VLLLQPVHDPAFGYHHPRNVSPDILSKDDLQEIFLADPCIQSVLSENNVTLTRTDPNPPKSCEFQRFVKNDTLKKLLDRVISVESLDKKLIVDISLKKLLEEFCQGFARAGIELFSEGGVCLIGSSASALISNIDNNFIDINDCDVMFHLKYPENFSEVLKIQESVIALILRKYLRKKFSLHECKNMFFKETFHVSNATDMW